MTYNALISTVAAQTGLPKETVRLVLLALPNPLVAMKEGEHVRTPLGVFRMMRRQERMVTVPTSNQALSVSPELVCKLRAGFRLRKPPVT